MLYGFHPESDKVTYKTVIAASTPASDFDKISPEVFAATDGFIQAWQMDITEIKELGGGILEFPFVVEVRTEAQRAAFDEKFGVEIVSLDAIREIYSKREEGKEEVQDNRTIAEIFDLDLYDPWSEYTPEQLERMDALERKYAKDKKAAPMSGDDSFAARPARSGDLRVTDVRVKEDADGNLGIDNILAQKDDEIEATHEFFIGRGENIYHKVEIYGKKIADIETIVQLERSKIFKDADYGCWVAFVAEKSGRNADRDLNKAGITTFRVYPCDGDGMEVVPKEALVDDVAFPRPWNTLRDQLAGMDAEAKKANLKTYKAEEFAYTLVPLSYPDYGTMIHIAPMAYVEKKNRMWGNPLGIKHLIPADFEEVSPGLYKSPYEEAITMHKLSERGFIDNFLMKAVINA